MLILFLFVYAFINGASATAATYPEDDYCSPVNFSLANAKPSDVKYRLFRTPNNNELSTVYTTESIKSSNMLPFLPTKFLIHGWTSNETSPWYKTTRENYFDNGPHNIFYIDWYIAGSQLYSISCANTVPVGEFIADFIIASGVELKRVHILGHSLGSHVAGFIGKSIFKKTGKKLGRITLLDPAGFKWQSLSSDLRADKTDARFVDVVHTDDGHYGFEGSIGHADYFPNGGKKQPGCPSFQEDDNCSHARSVRFFAESILNEIPFIGKRAKSWEDYLNGTYDEEDILFGDEASYDTRGNIYFKTNAEPPFAIKQ